MGTPPVAVNTVNSKPLGAAMCGATSSNAMRSAAIDRSHVAIGDWDGTLDDAARLGLGGATRSPAAVALDIHRTHWGIFERLSGIKERLDAWKDHMYDLADAASAINPDRESRAATREFAQELFSHGIGPIGSMGNPLARGAVPAARAIPWSSKVVRTAAEALDTGATTVRVGSRGEAAELLMARYGEGYRNTTGWNPAEVKNFFGAKRGTYHWDIGENAFPHAESHLQIHTFTGDIIRIFSP